MDLNINADVPYNGHKMVVVVVVVLVVVVLSGGQEGKLSGLFCAVLCATIVHSAMHTHERT